MNPTHILALISDLYGQIEVLARENDALRAQLAEASASD